jgi:hypothetical protein
LEQNEITGENTEEKAHHHHPVAQVKKFFQKPTQPQSREGAEDEIYPEGGES